MPTKLDQSSTASRKALALFGVLLFARQPLSLKQLAERLSCSRQTVLRLMEEVERANVIHVRKWKEAKENLYQAHVPDTRPNLDLSTSELTQLVLCRDLVRHMLPLGHREWLDTATNKAASMSRDAKDSVPDSIGCGVVKGAIDYKTQKPHWMPLSMPATPSRCWRLPIWPNPARNHARTLSCLSDLWHTTMVCIFEAGT